MAVCASAGASLAIHSAATGQFSGRIGDSGKASGKCAIHVDLKFCRWSTGGWIPIHGNGKKNNSSRRRRGMAAGKAVANAESTRPDGGLDNTVREAKGLAYEGPGQGGQWLSSTTRHVRIYIGVADPESALMDQSQLDKITLMLDPDDEFVWPDDKTQKVYDYFRELVDAYAGAPCTEYTLRLIGSDIEHYIRKLLLANEIKYNLNCRVLNFSMGKPRFADEITDGDGPMMGTL